MQYSPGTECAECIKFYLTLLLNRQYKTMFSEIIISPFLSDQKEARKYNVTCTVLNMDSREKHSPIQHATLTFMLIYCRHKMLVTLHSKIIFLVSVTSLSSRTKQFLSERKGDQIHIYNVRLSLSPAYIREQSEPVHNMTLY
jgi:hypothetical protein